MLLLFRSVCVAALFVVLGAVQSAPPPVTAPCGTCGATGKIEQPCSACDGDGKAPCPECAVDRFADMKRLRMHVTRCEDPEMGKKLADAMGSLDESLAKLGNLTGGLHPLVPGRVGCVAKCRSGTSFLNPGHACKVCGEKGSLPCVACKSKGEVTCRACEGGRKRTVTCPECTGSGASVDVASLGVAEVSRCAWCAGKGIRTCGDCAKDRRREQLCPRCTGAGKYPCVKCAGTRKAACAKCSGTGDLSAFLAAKSSNNCDHCDRKGVLPCDDCKDGWTKCAKCEGAKRGTFDCMLCVGPDRKAPCAGCWENRSLSWTTTAERLAAADRTPIAIAYLEEALRREEAAAQERAAAAGGDAAAKRESDRLLAKRRAELSARIEALRKPR